MIMLTYKPLLTSLSLIAALGATAHAQTAPIPASEPSAPPPATEVATGPLWQWSTSAGYNHYREPSINMQLRGPELGLHLRVSQLPHMPRWQAEGEVLGSLLGLTESEIDALQAEDLLK